MFDTPFHIRAPTDQTHPLSGGPRRNQLDVATRDIRLAAGPAPRGRDSHGDSSHDLSYDNVIAAPRGRHGRDDLSPALDQIEARIERIEHEIVALAPLVHERARLLRARAAILGESDPVPRAPSLPRHVKRDDVFRYLTRNPGSRAGEIAVGLGAAQGVVSAHLYRGKGRLFVGRAGRWYPVPEGDPG
jgi:hypothetical protein